MNIPAIYARIKTWSALAILALVVLFSTYIKGRRTGQLASSKEADNRRIREVNDNIQRGLDSVVERRNVEESISTDNSKSIDRLRKHWSRD